MRKPTLAATVAATAILIPSAAFAALQVTPVTHDVHVPDVNHPPVDVHPPVDLHHPVDVHHVTVPDLHHPTDIHHITPPVHAPDHHPTEPHHPPGT